jgi:peroxiredoxin
VVSSGVVSRQRSISLTFSSQYGMDSSLASQGGNKEERSLLGWLARSLIITDKERALYILRLMT